MSTKVGQEPSAPFSTTESRRCDHTAAGSKRRQVMTPPRLRAARNLRENSEKQRENLGECVFFNYYF
ncbi:hypothetical protein GDO81_026953 [Engystomops pustulosus]|uniref:Uncharacterized protein n=1 Tax=Engystomops pustulosus TaxID=76066 RepID=A0AAV6YKK9_ENGPU|nr:hypothetical protein GDO81_026953 [Engystomops pustulosus]